MVHVCMLSAKISFPLILIMCAMKVVPACRVDVVKHLQFIAVFYSF